MNKFTIVIVGLGLMGGSLAYALKGFRDCDIIGVEISEDVREQALLSGAVSEAFAELTDVVQRADLTIFCTYPTSIFEYIKTNFDSFKDGSVITEICGTKHRISEMITNLLKQNNHFDYIGIHPMAGKEVSGFLHAEASIFKNSGFIITPISTTKQETINLCTELAQYIGAKRIAISDAFEHDKIIGYSSDLMHISASALCLDFPEEMTLAHTAGAFRDCTRIAQINPELWTQLLIDNGDFIAPHLETYIQNLINFKNAISSKNNKSLYNLLDKAQINKKEIQSL